MTFPLVGASVDMDFTTGQYYSSDGSSDLVNQLSISRASVGYAKNASGVLIPFSSNLFRITDLGLLIEDARTNVAYFSQDLTQSSGGNGWTNVTSVTPFAGAAAAPDGTITASSIISVAIGGNHSISQNCDPGTITAILATWSCYFKPNGYNFAILGASDLTAGNAIMAKIDLLGLTINPTFQIFSGTPTNVSGTVEGLANGWVRATLSMTTANPSRPAIYVGLHDGISSTLSFVGDGVSGVFVWGAQVESASFASSYIPTTTTSATRAADLVTCAGSLATIVTGSTGSALVDVIASTIPVNFWRILGEPSSSHELMGVNGPGVNNQAIAYDGSTIVASGLFPSATFSGGAKVGASWNAGGRSVVGGGGTVGSDATLMSPAATCQLGNDVSAVNRWYGYFRRLTAWNSRLADATLQALTLPDFYDLLNDTLSAVGRGVVGSSPTNSSITTSGFALNGTAASGVVSNQFVGLSILFDGYTITPGLQGAAAQITANTASNTPTFTLITSLPATPVAGDTFSVN